MRSPSSSSKAWAIGFVLLAVYVVETRNWRVLLWSMPLASLFYPVSPVLMGAIVNLLSSPVVVGFTNAAALIIGLSQLSKVIGVPFPRSDRYLADLWHVVEQIGATHWPTLAFAVGAYLLIWGLRRISGAIPGVLIAVVVATAISAAIGFERKVDVPLNDIEDQAFVDTARAAPS